MRHALRLAVRQFTRHPAFALVTVLVLGLATGASVAVYTVVDAVLLRPLPYTSPQQLLTIWDTNQARGLTHEPMSPVTLMDYLRLDAFGVSEAPRVRDLHAADALVEADAEIGRR